MSIATLDFETRSACNIGDCGSWKYSLDPTTEILCMAFRLPYWESGRTALWHPAFPDFDIDEGPDFAELGELFEWIVRGELIEAWNAFFERGIWANIVVPKLGWPAVGPRQWRCAAAQAAAHSLPRNLGDAADALSLRITKDDEGSAVMKKMAKPRKPKKSDHQEWGRLHAPCGLCAGTGRIEKLKKDGTPSIKGQKCTLCGGSGVDRTQAVPDMPLLYHESREEFERLWAYCRIDVLAEEGISQRLPPLSDDETEMYLLDQTINERGFELDPVAIETALILIDEEFVDFNRELSVITEGKVERATQRDRMIAWFEEQGLEMENTQAATLDALLKRTDLPPHVYRAVELMRALGKSSTAKFETMQDWKCPDNRVRGGLLYHGASTGRWTGKGIQPHNFPRGVLKKEDSDPEFVWAVLNMRDREFITDTFGSVMNALSSGLRGVIRAKQGKQLYVADFNAIEPRVLFWLAEDHDALQVFHSGKCIYMDFASSVYGYPVYDKEKQDKERAFGKVGILGLGYQMGAAKFVDSAYNLSGGKVVLVEDTRCARCNKPSRGHDREQDHRFVYKPGEEHIITSLKVVNAYRSKYWRVKQMWGDQEAAAIRAVRDYPGQEVHAGRMTWLCDDDTGFLYCTLPSGRRLAYPEPAVLQRTMPWGDKKPCLTFMGVDAITRQWSTQWAYGGLLVENQTQAVARDLMAGALLRLERTGVYEPVLSVHDEGIAEADLGTGDVHEFNRLMAETPDWAGGLPVLAEGWKGLRYKK